MMWRTHVLFGISSLWLLAPVPPEMPGYVFGALAEYAILGLIMIALSRARIAVLVFTELLASRASSALFGLEQDFSLPFQ